MMNIMLKVFAAMNSVTRYGTGLIFAAFVKYPMKGVKVSTTMSLEVNTVRIETVTNNDAKSFRWSLPARAKVLPAR